MPRSWLWDLFFTLFSNNIYTCAYLSHDNKIHLSSIISNRGTWGKCKGDKKHRCFHWELNYGLNLGLKQRWYVYWTIKGSISNFRIIVFHSFSFLLKIKIPHVPRFDITRVICQAEEYTNNCFELNTISDLQGCINFWGGGGLIWGISILRKIRKK